jgi:hypothetical protein
MNKTLVVLSISILVISITFSAAMAQEDERADTSFKGLLGWEWELDPNDQPYPDYIADPRRPRMFLGVAYYDSEIPRTSSSRVLIDFGTRYTLFKITSPKKENEFALDIEGALFTQFDPGYSLNALGWDGRYGIFIVYNWHDKLATRIGYRHISAHLGDEYMEETGRPRVDYTRDDFALGLSYFITEQIMTYVEPSYAWNTGKNDRQEEWAVEGGAQYKGEHTMWNNSTAFYSGFHIRSFEETD